jgi:hypothetical protein
MLLDELGLNACCSTTTSFLARLSSLFCADLFLILITGLITSARKLAFESLPSVAEPLKSYR